MHSWQINIDLLQILKKILITLDPFFLKNDTSVSN